MVKTEKNEFQELTNQAIQEHNRRTGEKVSKIDFKAREGKGSKHIGMTDIAYAVRYNAPVKKIQKELDRRIRNATEEENRKIAKSEKELIKKSTKLTIMDKITVAVAPLIENPFNAAKRAVKRENIRMAMHREKLTPLQKEKLAKIHEKNVQKAEDLILEKQDKFNAGLKREAENAEKIVLLNTRHTKKPPCWHESGIRKNKNGLSMRKNKEIKKSSILI